MNPTDERYTKFHGMHTILPIYGRKVEVKPHPSAKAEFGTGAVMICSYGDYTDVLLFRELGLKEVLAVGPDGRPTAAAGTVPRSKDAGGSLTNHRRPAISGASR